MPELCLQEYGFVTVLFLNIYRLFVNPVTARDILVPLQYQSFAKAITVSDFLQLLFHYVRMDCEGIENYYHSYGSLPYQSEYSFQNCALFLSSFTAAGGFRYKLSHTDSGGGAYAYCSRPQHFPQHTDFRIPALYLRRQPIT